MHYLVKHFAKHNLDVETIAFVYIDSAPALLRNKFGFYVLIKREIPHLQIIYCFLYHHALAAKTLALNLKEVLDHYVITVSWAMGRVLNHHISKLFCNNLGK